MEKLRVFEAFAGYGSQSMALNRLDIDYEVVAISEIDKFAIKSYKEIHGDVLNLGDISKINTEDIPDHDLFTYSFPCQDISIAGKQGGFSQGSGTRSGLLWECQKVIAIKKPKFLVLENVKDLVSKKFMGDFQIWLDWLESQGYSTKWDILNSKDFGVPQNRERVFAISILGDSIDFKFPKGKYEGQTIKDILQITNGEFNVSQLLQDRFELRINMNNDIKILGTTNPGAKIGQRDITYDINGIMGALTATDYKQPKQVGLYDDSIDFENLTSDNVLVRKLTPRECGRLMGVADIDISKMESVNSNTQLYKQFGNSIVVDVLVEIFSNMFGVDKIEQ